MNHPWQLVAAAALTYDVFAYGVEPQNRTLVRVGSVHDDDALRVIVRSCALVWHCAQRVHLHFLSL